MNLKIVNCPDKDLKPYIERAAKYFSEELIPNKRIRNNCYTVIVFNDKITEFGCAEIVSYNTLKKAREFKIEIHPGIGVRNIFETLDKSNQPIQISIIEIIDIFCHAITIIQKVYFTKYNQIAHS